mmetsp:Transcript_1325/g.5107  ORF Transcript_1325/g.5107 Transcript_1325/m.5107 type:complete len:508 (-) Transcript_1325:367-1890(-)
MATKRKNKEAVFFLSLFFFDEDADQEEAGIGEGPHRWYFIKPPRTYIRLRLSSRREPLNDDSAPEDTSPGEGGLLLRRGVVLVGAAVLEALLDRQRRHFGVLIDGRRRGRRRHERRAFVDGAVTMSRRRSLLLLRERHLDLALRRKNGRRPEILRALPHRRVVERVDRRRLEQGQPQHEARSVARADGDAQSARDRRDLTVPRAAGRGLEEAQDDREDRAEHGGHAVEVVDAARVVQAELGVEDVHGEARGAHEAGADADEQRGRGPHREVGDGADRDAAGERRSLGVHGVDSLVSRAWRRDEGRNGRAAEREHRVRDGALRGQRARGERRRDEGGPVEPERRGAEEGDDLGGGRGLLFDGGDGRAEDVGHGEAEIRAEHVNHDRFPAVLDADDLLEEHAAVERVRDALDQSQHHELRGRDLADVRAERDEHRRDGQVGLDERLVRDGDAVPPERREERLGEQRGLDADGRDKQREAHGAHAVPPQERHEEAKADDHHEHDANIDVI